jgi:hypothetical protein
VTSLLKQPNELLAKFSLAIDDKDIRHIGVNYSRGHAVPDRGGSPRRTHTNAVQRGCSTVRVELAWFRG